MQVAFLLPIFPKGGLRMLKKEDIIHQLDGELICTIKGCREEDVAYARIWNKAILQAEKVIQEMKDIVPEQ